MQTGQTALSIAQKLGYISVVETLKVVTDTVVTTTTTTTVEEKYKVLAPESMQETFMSDSEDEGGEETRKMYISHFLLLSIGHDSVLPISKLRSKQNIFSFLPVLNSSCFKCHVYDLQRFYNHREKIHFIFLFLLNQDVLFNLKKVMAVTTNKPAAQTLPDEAPPMGKIHPFCKIAVTF